jgi:nitrilase
MRRHRAAILQARPDPTSLRRSLEKACTLIGEAAALGAEIAVLGETWLPGYPVWLDVCPSAALWNHGPTKDVFARLRENSVVVPGEATEALSSLARKAGISIAIGVNERVDRGPGSGTLYNSLLLFNERGELVIHHRKLVPTYTERLVWGQGDADGLVTAPTKVGLVGGLICWEHWMPLARQALHDQGESVHLALWPTAHEDHQLASRHYAMEGRCYVLCAASLLAREDLPEELAAAAEVPQGGPWLVRGGSSVIGPDGKYLVPPVHEREEILVADLDMRALDRERMTLDVSGHYSRPDLLRLEATRGTRR